MKNLFVSVRGLLVFTLLLGLIYPAVITALGNIAFPKQAQGSLIFKNGVLVGSALLAQETKSPKYFHPRPSAVNYALPSGGSNLGPTSAALKKTMEERRAAGEIASASASGLDPHISPEDAIAQVSRVATARGMSEPSLRALVNEATITRLAGVFGEPMVNVIELNLMVDEAK